MQTFIYLFFLKHSTVVSLYEATTTASLTFRANTLARLAPIVVSHITVMQFLNKNISPSAWALLPFPSKAVYACSPPVIGRVLLAGSALLFSRSPLNISLSSGGTDEVFLLLWSMKGMTVNLKMC